MSARELFLSRLKALTEEKPIPVAVEFWDGERFAFAPCPTVTITLRSPATMRSFLTGRMDRLGDAYATGEIGVEGAVEDILDVGIRLTEAFGRVARIASALQPLGRLAFRHSRANDSAAVQQHYDISNAFYRLWLDDGMTYSCAYFEAGEEDIDCAQRQKIAHICRKLRLAPGDRLLDIGCGWGGLLRQAARGFSIRGVGITNSPAQAELARERIAADGLSDRIEIRLMDYRDLDEAEAFDKIVSVGMYEHVGLANLGAYFGTIQRSLKPGGILLNHGIVTTDPEGRPQGPPGGDFIGRHVFPGGELPNLSRALQEIARSELETVDVEDLRPHYARTLQLWVRRLERNAEAAIAAAGVEHYRIWRIFLAGMAFAFDRRWLSIAQVVAYKPDGPLPAPRPWTRAHQYRPDESPAIAGPLTWKGPVATETPAVTESPSGTSPVADPALPE